MSKEATITRMKLVEISQTLYEIHLQLDDLAVELEAMGLEVIGRKVNMSAFDVAESSRVLKEILDVLPPCNDDFEIKG